MPQASEQTDRQNNGGNSDDGDDPSPADAFGEAFAQVNELRDYAVQYLTAQLHAFILECRHRAAWTLFRLVALLAAVSALITGVVLLICGLAQAVSALCGDRAWAGNLIVGTLLLAMAIGSGWLRISRWFDFPRRNAVARYEQRLKQQRSRHGHDARQRSAEFDADHSAKGANRD